MLRLPSVVGLSASRVLRSPVSSSSVSRWVVSAAACSHLPSCIRTTTVPGSHAHVARFSSSSHSSGPPPAQSTWFRRNWYWLLAAGFGLPALITAIDWTNEPKSTPPDMQPAAEKHIPGAKRKREKIFAASLAPPASAATSATTAAPTATTAAEVEPSPTHADHASCRACREGESSDVNAVFNQAQASTASSAASSSSATAASAQETPVFRSTPTSCPPCYAYSHSLCPLNRAEVGRAAWGYLHTMVAYYPDSPSQKQKDEMARFINLYMKLYPCGYCADRSMEQLEREPIEKYVDSQLALSGWMCRAHNEVNERLGKPIFDCKFANQRWRDGPPTGECD